MRINSFFFKIIRIHYSTFNFFKFFSHFISKSGFNTPQLAVADFERLKLLVAESEKFRGEYFVACCGDSEILGNFFIRRNNIAISKIINKPKNPTINLELV